MAQDLFPNMHRQVAEASAQATEDETRVVDEIESLCMNCHADGTTRLLLTKIPYFHEVVLTSFECPHCHFRNTEVDSAGEIQQDGVRYSLKADQPDDLQRQIVKSQRSVFRIEDIDLEIPPGRGQLTNVEGLLTRVAEDLELAQPERQREAPEAHAQIENIIQKLRHMASGAQLPFTITADDPAGLCSIEPRPAEAAGKYSKRKYPRTAAQNEELGLAASAPTAMRPEYQATQMYPEMPEHDSAGNVDDDIVENQVYSFVTQCPGCTATSTTNMKMVNVPHFKQVVVMSTTCDHCGYRSTEVKTGGEIPDKGRRITLSVERPEDLTRDILKAESCAMHCPELELSVEPGTMGGRFTTVEGILAQVRDDLRASVFEGDGGDAQDAGVRPKWDAFFARLSSAMVGDVAFRLVLEDPLAASYVQSFAAPDPDAQMMVEEFERSAEQDDDLGLRDMCTEGYEEDAAER